MLTIISFWEARGQGGKDFHLADAEIPASFSGRKHA